MNRNIEYNHRTRDNEYYRYTSLYSFKHPSIAERYNLRLHKEKLNINLLLGIYVFLISVLPLIVQIRALTGEFGILWIIATVLLIFNIIVLSIRIVMETFYHSIEAMDISRRSYYYKIKTYLNNFYLINHSFVISMNLYLKTDRVCGHSVSVYDTQFCNVSPVNGMPMDTFVILLFLLILYHQLFPVDFIYTFAAQVIQFITVVIVAIKTTSTSTWPLNLISVSMFLGACTILFYLQANMLDKFILEDSLQTFEIHEATHNHYRSRINGRINDRYEIHDNRSIPSLEQSVNATLFYNTINRDGADARFIDTRARGNSNSTISSFDDFSQAQ